MSDVRKAVETALEALDMSSAEHIDDIRLKRKAEQLLTEALAHLEAHEFDIRDTFATTALNGMLANRNYEPPRRKKAEGFAEDAYIFADAMLKERLKEPPKTDKDGE